MIDDIMKMKPAARTIAVAILFGGSLCWSAMADDASQLWNMNCAACHGKDGKGNTMMGHRLQIKDLTDPKVQDALTDDQATKDIKDGIKENDRPVMKAFGEKLNDDQIKALVAEVRSFKK
jgi:mono/diheme cytochrome c family protein